MKAKKKYKHQKHTWNIKNWLKYYTIKRTCRKWKRVKWF